MNTDRTPDNEARGFDRRALIRRTAVIGTVAWAVPTIESFTPASASDVGTPQPGACNSCLTGGGALIDGVTYNGVSIPSLSFGLGQICCGSTAPGEAQIEVNAHPTSKTKDDISFHFVVDSVTCSKADPSPEPPLSTVNCDNVFMIVASGDPTKGTAGYTLNATLADHGEGQGSGIGVDTASITITGPNTLSGSGSLNKGNLQVHEGLGNIAHDCSGC
jgi:hypothetical protein